MKTFFRKLFNLRTDEEIVLLLFLYYKRGFICINLEQERYKHVLTSKEHKRLLKLVTAHLGERATASSWCLNRKFISLEELEVCCAKVEPRHRKIFLTSLYANVREGKSDCQNKNSDRA